MKIEITSGAYGLNNGGLIKPVYRGEVCEVPDKEAGRLIALGAARAVATAAEPPCVPCPVNDSPEDNGAETADMRLDREQLSKLTASKLRELAEDMEIDCTRLRTKAQLIAAICDTPLEDCIEEIPVFDAAGSVV